MSIMEHGAQVTTEDGIVGYVLGWQEAPSEAPHAKDLRVFHFDSSGEPWETIGNPITWTETGKTADRLVLAHMNVWQAEQDLVSAMEGLDTCQRCGGHPGMIDDMHRCLCA